MPANLGRQQTLDLLSGPAMQVTLTTSTGNEKIWTLPKALLCYHASYFQRLYEFKEGNEGRVTVEGFEPETFELFVEFVYYGRYTYRDDLSDPKRIRDSAKVWALADYLDAVDLKNFAMKNLHNIYFPKNGQDTKCLIGPEMVDYCCAMAPDDSNLIQFIRDVLVVYWHRNDIVIYSDSNYEQWEYIWQGYPLLRNDVFWFLNQSEDSRGMRRKSLEQYWDEPATCDEPGATEDLPESSPIPS